MGYLVLGLAVLAIFLLAGNAFARANPATLAQQVRVAGGLMLLAVAAGLAVTGRWVLAIPIGGFALSLLGFRQIPGFGRVGGTTPRGGAMSTVRSAYLEMRLDHDSGEMNGTVLAGAFEGKELSALAPDALHQLWREVAGDAESRALLEAYLDRRQPGWRVDFEADGTDGEARAANAGPMTKEEAYQVLGLQTGSGEPEIRAAHRRLMKRLHPDMGGSAFLAAKLNEAKDTLLGRH